jgi:hypothetical protein
MSGPVPITHLEIRAWQENSGIELTPWQSALLRRLSQEYIGQLQQAEDSNCKPPFGKLYKLNAKALSKAIDAAL